MLTLYCILLVDLLFLPYYACTPKQEEKIVNLPQAQISDEARRTRIYYNEGVQLHNLGNSKQAITQFDLSLLYDPLYVPAHERLQDIYRFILGKEDSIRTVYKTLKDSFPDNVEYIYLAGRLLDIEEREPEFNRAIRLDSLFYWGYYGLGNIYLTTGFFDEAVKQYKKAVAINPAIPDAELALGLAYENLNQYAKAVKQYKKALHINPKVAPDGYFFLGRIYADKADTSQSLERFKQYASQSFEHFKQYLDLVKKGEHFDFARKQFDNMKTALDSVAVLEDLKKSGKK